MSLIEVLMALALLAAVVGPLVLAYRSSGRVGFSANRRVEGMLHAQTILEAITELDVEELPPVAAGSEVDLLPGGGGGAGSFRWREVEAFFATGPPFEMQRRVSAREVGDGVLLVTVSCEWQPFPGDRGAAHEVAVSGLVHPRVW